MFIIEGGGKDYGIEINNVREFGDEFFLRMIIVKRIEWINNDLCIY